jgi:hemolysin III
MQDGQLGRISMQEQAVTEVYSTTEEIAHSVTHGIGVLLSVVGLATLIVYSSKYGDAWHIVSSSIYGATLIALYTASALYHGVTVPRVKNVLQRLDHAAIFLLIAGTYTPFTLVNLRGGWGWSLFGTVWSVAVAGMIMELIVTKRSRRISIALYLGLGWLVAIAIQPVLANVAPGGLILLVVGGLFYSLGVIFYVWRTLAFHHAIWHLFVLAGSAAHFFAVFLYVIPNGATA